MKTNLKAQNPKNKKHNRKCKSHGVIKTKKLKSMELKTTKAKRQKRWN